MVKEAENRSRGRSQTSKSSVGIRVWAIANRKHGTGLSRKVKQTIPRPAGSLKPVRKGLGK